MPQAELKALDVAAAHFFETRENLEVDLSGPARARFGIEERAKLEDDLVAMLERLHDPKFAPSKADPKPREQELAKLMSEIAVTKDNPDMPPGFITHDGVLKTQKQWLRYRDALIALVRKVRPAAEIDAWRQHFAGAVDVREIDGGHYFVKDAPRSVVDVVLARLALAQPA